MPNKKTWLARHGTEEDWKQIQQWKAAQRKQRKKKKRERRKQKREALVNQREIETRRFLEGFWKKWDTLPNTAMRTEYLRRAAQPRWGRIDNAVRLKLRKQFTKKYPFLLSEIDGYCGCCGNEVWKEKHHIVPLSHGGINENVNLLAICIKCHDEIHPWMKQ